MICLQYSCDDRDSATDRKRRRYDREQQVAKPTVVVVGGGYGGITVAKALDETSDVVLVEPKDAFMHNIAALRALVDPVLAPEDLPALRGAAHQRPSRSGPSRRGRPAPGGDGVGRGDLRRLRRAGHRVEVPLPGQDGPRRHPSRPGAGPPNEPGARPGGSGPAGRRGPGRHRVGRRDPSRVAGEVDRPARRRRRDSRWSVHARAEGRAPTPTGRIPGRADPRQPACGSHRRPSPGNWPPSP